MASYTIGSASESQEQHGEEAIDVHQTLVKKINLLIKQIQEERIESIKEKIQRNRKNLQCQLSEVMSTISRKHSLQTEENTVQMLSSRMDHPLCKFSSFSQCLGEDNHNNNQDTSFVKSIKIPYIERLPPYTFWIHLAENARMTEDQSVVGRRNIYYDQHGGETLICSDSDEELKEHKEVKHNFSRGEDQIIWMAFEEHGLTEDVLSVVRSFVEGSDIEIQERYKNLKEVDQHTEDSGERGSHIGICLDKSLSVALDTFDHLFCRQCLIFDCPLHGSSRPLIYPCEKQPVWSEPEGDRKPCSEHCYLRLKDVNISSKNSTPESSQDKKIKIVEEVDGILAPSVSGNQSTKAILQKETCNYVTTHIKAEVDCHKDLNSNVPVSESMEKQKVSYLSDSALCDSTVPPDESKNSRKKLKRVLEDKDTTIGDYNSDLNLDACNEEKHTITRASLKSLVEPTSNNLVVSGSTSHGEHDKGVEDGQKDVIDEMELKQLSNSIEGKVDEMPSISDWKPMEKELYLKGIEMFGRNSCLIYRNLLSSLKTCMEVASYMYADVSMPHGSMDKNGKFDEKCTDIEMPSRSRSLRKRSKTRKFRYSLKSSGLPSAWKGITEGKNQTYKQYTPCACRGKCGKECSCLLNGSCCEKYCGCSKLCRNRFRGCHCSKSQCRSRQCPCFAAARECDPDVCRNCWVSCGDDSLGESAHRGDGQCGNMRLLLRQKQRILLAKSNIAGWGAFLKNPTNKNDYIGEYTGELVSQIEAEKRGKLYDRANFSFLFNLNDQYVLDAYRKGDKLKFANHSSKPNCYAKIMLVGGDHRVGIFAKESIEAGEELFYDYHYGPNHTPPWVLELLDNGSMKNESGISKGKGKKHLSH